MLLQIFTQSMNNSIQILQKSNQHLLFLKTYISM